MSRRPSCEEVEMLAPEVALGIASGDERALVLAHVKSCRECRLEMERLSATADSLLLVGPTHEPTPGFESEVLAKIESARRPAHKMRSKLIAAALASVVITGVGAFWVTSDDRRVADHYRDALAVANGEYFGVVPLETTAGDRAGHLFAYEGDTPWVFLIFEPPLEAGRYQVELVTRTDGTRPLGTAELSPGQGTWGRDIPVGLRAVSAVRMIDDAGAVVAQATFPSR